MCSGACLLLGTECRQCLHAHYCHALSNVTDRDAKCMSCRRLDEERLMDVQGQDVREDESAPLTGRSMPSSRVAHA